MSFIGTLRVCVGLMAVDMLVFVRMRVPMRVCVGVHQITVAMLVNVKMLVRMFMMMLVSLTVRLAGSVVVFVSVHGGALAGFKGKQFRVNVCRRVPTGECRIEATLLATAQRESDGFECRRE